MVSTDSAPSNRREQALPDTNDTGYQNYLQRMLMSPFNLASRIAHYSVASASHMVGMARDDPSGNVVHQPSVVNVVPSSSSAASSVTAPSAVAATQPVPPAATGPAAVSVSTNAIPHQPAQLNTVTIATDDVGPEQYFDIPDGMTAEQSRSSRIARSETVVEPTDRVINAPTVAPVEQPPKTPPKTPPASTSSGGTDTPPMNMNHVTIVSRWIAKNDAPRLARFIAKTPDLCPVAREIATTFLGSKAPCNDAACNCDGGFMMKGGDTNSFCQPVAVHTVDECNIAPELTGTFSSDESDGKGGGGDGSVPSGVSKDDSGVTKKGGVSSADSPKVGTQTYGSFPVPILSEAKALKAAMDGSAYNSVSAFKGIGVSIPRDERLKPGERGYQDERKEMTRGPKASHCLGVCDYASTSLMSSSGDTSSSADVVKRMCDEHKKIEHIILHIKKYDLGSLLKLFKPLPGITRDCSVDVTPDRLFDVSSKPQDVWSHWGLFRVEDIRLIQRFWNTSCYVSGVDKDTSQILQEYLMNCLTPALQKKVEEDLKKFFEPSEIGGVSVAWTILRTAFALSPTSADGLRRLLEEFGEKGLMSVEGQSPVEAQLKLKLLVNQLLYLQQLRTTDVGVILDGLRQCSCTEFKELYQDNYISNLRSEISVATLDQPLALGAAGDQQHIAETIFKHLESAVDLFISLKNQSKWTHSSTGKDLSAYQVRSTPNLDGGGGHGTGCKCFNCGENHLLKDCKKARHEPTIKKNRDAFMKEKKNRSNKSTGGGGGGGGGGGFPSRDANGNLTNTGGGGGARANHLGNNSWQINAETGLVEFRCAKCHPTTGSYRWGNHPTVYHDDAVNNPSFKYWDKAPKCPIGKQARAAYQRHGNTSSPAGGEGGGTSTSDKELQAQRAAYFDIIKEHGSQSAKGGAALVALQKLDF